MSTPAAVALVAACALVAFALRASMTVGLSGVALPASVERGLSYIGPAVLASMTVNFAFGGEGGPFFRVATVATMAVALVVAVWKRNLLFTLAAAMPVLWVTTAWFG